MTVAFKTFGCRLNRAEALDLEADFLAAGHTIVPLPSEGSVPDLIIVRGCSVTARAQRDCEKEIEHLRKTFPFSQVIVTGCLPNAGTDPLKSLGTGPLAPPFPEGSVPNASLPSGSVPQGAALDQFPSRAFLKVQDGCSGRCAFCIVPHFRGQPVSVPFDHVLDRARAFLAAGFRELVVTGCNLALYRSQGHGLPDLLSALAELPAPSGSVPTHRIRLGSLEPGICDAALLTAFESHPNICRFIHHSVQSGSDRVLARMNRPYPIATVARFRNEARRRLGPRLALGADIITGFPGETDEDFQLTKSFLFPTEGSVPKGTPCQEGSVPNDTPCLEGSVPFSNLHVFPYSERPGTPAATMDGALPRAIRLARARELEAHAKAARLAFARSFLGQDVEICVERGGDHGWTAEYLPCKLKGAPAPRRSLLSVRVTDVSDAGELIAVRP